MSDEPNVVETAQFGMATTFRIRIAGWEPLRTRQVCQEAFEELARCERALSRFIEGSDVDRINRAACGVPVRIGADAFECLSTALRLMELTGGAFDPTLGALTRRELDGESRDGRGSAPAGRALAASHRLMLDADSLTAIRIEPDAQIDLGAIGKGYAIDRMAEVLRDWEAPAFQIESGGSTVLAFSELPGVFRWEVRLEAHGVERTIALNGAALGASGIGVQGLHLLDGRTGQPVTTRLRAWALAPTATEADALSTAAFVLSEPELAALARRNPRYGFAGADLEIGGKAGRLFALGDLRL